MPPSSGRFREFVRDFFSLLSPDGLGDALRFTSSEWSAHVRQMHSRLVAEGPGLFCEQSDDESNPSRLQSGRRARTSAVSASSGGMYVATW